MNQDSVVTTLEKAELICIKPPKVILPARKAGSARKRGMRSTVCI